MDYANQLALEFMVNRAKYGEMVNSTIQETKSINRAKYKKDILACAARMLSGDTEGVSGLLVRAFDEFVETFIHEASIQEIRRVKKTPSPMNEYCIDRLYGSETDTTSSSPSENDEARDNAQPN